MCVDASIGGGGMTWCCASIDAPVGTYPITEALSIAGSKNIEGREDKVKMPTNSVSCQDCVGSQLRVDERGFSWRFEPRGKSKSPMSEQHA